MCIVCMENTHLFVNWLSLERGVEIVKWERKSKFGAQILDFY